MNLRRHQLEETLRGLIARFSLTTEQRDDAAHLFRHYFGQTKRIEFARFAAMFETAATNFEISLLDTAMERVAELEALIDTPHTGDFFESVKLEAAHQVKRWGSEHDAGKTPAEWFWLVGYLLGKALHFPEKRKHHLVSSAAALLNWFRAEVGDSNAMRPGIEPPKESA